MLKQLRLPVLALIASTALIACGDKETANTEQSKAPATSVAPAAPAPVAAPEISVGMKEADVVAKYGEPALTQTRELDSLVITHSEWKHDSGITSVQFQNGEAKFVTVIAK
jgi:hypothetical protein